MTVGSLGKHSKVVDMTMLMYKSFYWQLLNRASGFHDYLKNTNSLQHSTACYNIKNSALHIKRHCALIKGVGSDVHRAPIQAWTRLILFTNTSCRSACEMFLMYVVIAVFNSLSVCGRSWYTADFAAPHRRLSAQRLSECTVHLYGFLTVLTITKYYFLKTSSTDSFL
jgi:hypothetical protein